MQDRSLENMASKKKSSGITRYVPAMLISIGLVFALLVAPKFTSWSRPIFYKMFLLGKGAPPTSNSVAIVSIPANNNQPTRLGEPTRLEALNVAKAILKYHPSVLVLNLPSKLTSDSNNIDKKNVSGNVVLGHDLLLLKPWTFSDASVQEYPAIISKSMYTLLDAPTVKLNLSMGDNPILSDSLSKWHFPSTGFSAPLTSTLSSQNIFSIPAFARLGHGVVANLGIESVRRALSIPAEKVAYLDGIGILFNATHVLPVNKEGEMFLRFHAKDGIAHFNSEKILSSSLDAEALKNKIVFLDFADENPVLIATVAGHLTSTAIVAEAAANFVDNLTITSPNWGGILAITLGLLLAILVMALMVLDLGNFITLPLSILLAALYPVISFIIFLKSSWWLSPELPIFMVLAVFIPFALTTLTKLFLPTSVKKSTSNSDIISNQSSNPQANSSIASLEKSVHVNTNLSSQPFALAGGSVNTNESRSPSVAPALSPSQAQQFIDPRDPPIISGSEANDSKDSLPRHAHATTQATPVITVTHPGTLTEDIERDAKGMLLRLGKYQIVRKMGFGSAGDVFEGVDSKMGRRVAIKTITKNGPAHFDKAAERFVIEAKAAGSLNHPCINTVYDFGTIGDVSYMVLEHLDGITLSQWMRNQPTPPTPASVIPWLQQISSALDYAHSHKVIHRDLKPSNLMVVNGGSTIKLLDFGIAKLEDVGLTQTGMTVGTPSYMSPEQLSGFKVQATSDQYGLAVVIYQLLTYKLPYIGTKIPELCNRILKNDLVPIMEVNPNISPVFWEALKKGLAKSPEARYGSCTELVQALSQALSQS